MIHVGDCLQVMRMLEANSFDSIVTDPPYHLTNRGGGPARGADNPYSRAKAGASSRGFMGKAWDGGDIAHQPETWAEALRVAKPGAWLAAFGGTRTYHRLACAIEDAGWELRDCGLRGHTPEDCEWLAGWLYGSGFPKSHNGDWGGTALKPAWEPIVLARKPLEGTVEANWRKWSTGALNIDGCRIEAEPRRIENYASEGSQGCMSHGHGGGNGHAGKQRTVRLETAGRWPANLIHDGSEEVLAAFPEAPGQQARSREDGSPMGNVIYGAMRHIGPVHEPRVEADKSAARFFYCAKASKWDRDDGLEAFALKEAPKFEGGDFINPMMGSDSKRTLRANTHPTVKPTDLMRWLCRLVTPAGGLVLDPFAGSGSTGRGAIAEGFRFTGIELDPEYARIAEARIRAVQPGLALGAFS